MQMSGKLKCTKCGNERNVNLEHEYWTHRLVEMKIDAKTYAETFVCKFCKKDTKPKVKDKTGKVVSCSHNSGMVKELDGTFTCMRCNAPIEGPKKQVR